MAHNFMRHNFSPTIYTIPRFRQAINVPLLSYCRLAENSRGEVGEVVGKNPLAVLQIKLNLLSQLEVECHELEIIIRVTKKTYMILAEFICVGIGFSAPESLRY